MSVKKSAVKSIRSLLTFALVFCLCFSVMPSILVYATGDGTAGMEGEAAETEAVPGSEKVVSEEAETPAAPTEETETPAEPTEETETPAVPAEETETDEGTETDTENEESKLTEEDKPIPGAKEEESGTPAGEQGSFRLKTLFVPMGGARNGTANSRKC